MKKLFMIFSLLLLLIPAKAQTSFVAGDLRVSFGKQGNFTELVYTKTGINYLYSDTLAPLITLIYCQKRHLPDAMRYNSSKKIIALSFSEIQAKVEVKVTIRKTHITFEIVGAEPAAKIDGLVWGPVPTTITGTIGEIIGVVRDEKVGLGIQVLNPKTLGGDYNKEGMTWSRGEAAVKKNWGSVLQAYSISRDKLRFVDTWGGEYKNTPVAPIKGETVVGSKISMFICEEPATLDRIEQIEIAEQLPHETINGVWVKKAIQRGRSYLIAGFNESEIDEMIAYTKRAGLISLYHEGPFLNWGHYDLNPEYFPGGKEGIKKCARKAKDAGLYFGVHTLTNFINTNDPYVTPVPDDRLALTGYGLLTGNLDEKATEIPVSTNEYFQKQENNWLHTVKIGKELIRYKSVTETPPYKLLDCQRGAFKSKVSSHSANDTVGKLYDHAYEVFFPNFELQREIATNLASFFNETGISHLDFDGHEGSLASGQGDYAINLFARDFYDHLDHEVLNGTSLSKTYYWHINTFCNWGEPWYGGFKESMQEYRISNQELFDRNYIPHMLGWYLLTENTTMSEMEWMLARAAGYDAGFAMVAHPKSVKNNPIGLQLLDAIREWETARLALAFSTEQKERLKNPKNEFHLEHNSEGEWYLFQYQAFGPFVHEKIIRQPGEPTNARWNFELKSYDQPLQFKIDIAGKSGSISKLKIQLDNYSEIEIDQEMLPGETLICDGSRVLKLYDVKGKQKSTIELNSKIPVLSVGNHMLTFNAVFKGTETPRAEFTVKAMRNPEKIFAQKK